MYVCVHAYVCVCVCVRKTELLLEKGTETESSLYSAIDILRPNYAQSATATKIMSFPDSFVLLTRTSGLDIGAIFHWQTFSGRSAMYVYTLPSRNGSQPRPAHFRSSAQRHDMCHLYVI